MTMTVNANEINEKQLFSTLMYGSYKANRGYGMTHEALVRIGIDNDAFKEKYEKEQINKN